MIGGEDIYLKIDVKPATALEVCARALTLCWPRAIFQDGVSGRRFDFFSIVPFASLREIMVHRDGPAWESWESLGADPSNRNTMIHLIVEDRQLAVVVDEATAPEMQRILNVLRGSLLDKSCNLRRPPEKAA